jgi:7,8-dihydroneopterin aldolase/epimerase/oxygenase
MNILIENLTFDTIIGIQDFERLTPQTVQIDCIIDYHYSLNFFINYVEVTQLIQTTMDKEKFELIEEALESLIKTLKEAFPRIHSMTLTIRKPTILPNCTVGVSHFKQFIHNNPL